MLTRKDSRSTVIAVVVVALMAGCRQSPPPEFPNPMEGVALAQGNEGFDLLVRAAAAAEADAPRLISRSEWTPGTRKAAINAAGRGLSLLKHGIATKARFAFTPYPPGQTRPSVRGWRFLGQALEWRIEEAVNAGSYAKACADFDLVFRFGSVLMGADTSVASLGIAIVGNAKRHLWPVFSKMPANLLAGLGARTATTLKGTPSARTAISSERATMMTGVQWVMDCFRSGHTSELGTTLGKPALPVVRYLKELGTAPREDQVAFFKGLIAEGGAEFRQLTERAGAETFDRAEFQEPRGERPWRRLSAALFRSGRYFLEARTKFDAEMRLFVMDAQLLARFKRLRTVPDHLEGFAVWLRRDPFSGRDMAYLPQGSDYRLYSIGPDGVDNGGDVGPGGAKEDIIPAR